MARSRPHRTRRHLRGVGEKEQRQYEHIKGKSQKSGRYGRRAKEVAARTLMKQHNQKGHQKGRYPSRSDLSSGLQHQSHL